MRRRVPMQRSAWERKRKPSALRTRKPIKARNDKRRIANWLRAYGSKERVEWVKSLPCLVSGTIPSENAHVVGGGAGRKADADKIVPLSRDKHDELHRVGVAPFEQEYKRELCGRTLLSWAATIQHAWLLQSGEAAA